MRQEALSLASVGKPNGKSVVVFAGEYDIACKKELRTELERIAMLPGLILDFTAVTYLDSICIGELIRFHKLRSESLFEPETFVIHTPNIRKLFDLLHLDKVFQITDSVALALGRGGEANVKYAFTVDGAGHAEPLRVPAFSPTQFA